MLEKINIKEFKKETTYKFIPIFIEVGNNKINLSYGGIYNFGKETVSLLNNIPRHITFNHEMPSHNIKVCTNNDLIKINKDGIYEINYFLQLIAPQNIDLEFSLRLNNNKIDSATINKFIKGHETSTFNGSIILKLNKNDFIDMTILTNSFLNITLSEKANASITIKELF